MFKTILKYGSLAGLVVGGSQLVMHLVNGNQMPGPYSIAVGYLIMLVALSAVFFGVRRHRDDALGGVIGFWRAFGLGLAISLVAAIFYVAAWEVVVATSTVDFSEVWSNYMIEQERAKGAAGNIAKVTAEMAEFRAQYANPLWRMPMVFSEIFPVGVLVSLVSAFVLRRRGFPPAQPSTAASEGSQA